jgi:S-adenosylmethionine:tRNA ribosyltransferase-isomerase
MDTALLDYELPPELIAQQPVEPRDASRLLVYRREPRTIEHRTFAELPAVLDGELVVVNDTRVVPGRLRLRRATGGAVEVLLVEPVDEEGIWEALVKPSSRLRVDEMLGPVRLVGPLGAGRWLVELRGEPAGEVPLPPYIHEALQDPERYQTVYANARGSAAAPTAGLHLTPALLARLDEVRITLHVGLDTFRPVVAATLDEHELHGERYAVAPDAWERIAAAHRVLAVGTTTVRALETVASTGELAARTTLFITPGFQFRRVDALVTNFHLPRSTLLALVMAFVGVDETRRIYREAIAERYRFYSFGDAMAAL